MQSSVKVRPLPASSEGQGQGSPLVIDPIREDGSSPARGILIACAVSLVFWLALITILI